jgi:sulfite reductase (NADPH) flavoprotein alpha-component
MTASNVLYIPETAPFSTEQRAWLNGFVAGLLGGQAAESAGSPPSKGRVLVLFGSQSGNSEALANRIARKLREHHFEVVVSGMDAVEPHALAAEKRVLVVTSTWGEGEMPDNAQNFWHAISNGSSPDLSHVEYSVLALGDLNYASTFCMAGKEFDRRFEELGARRIHPRADCDVDFDGPASEWLAGVLKMWDVAGANTVQTSVAEEHVPAAAACSRTNPFPAPLVENRALSGKGSEKDVRHIAFSLADSGILYEPGDALGVVPKNDPGMVGALLTVLGAHYHSAVASVHGGERPAFEVFLEELEITKITRELLGLIAERNPEAEFVPLMEHEEKLERWLWGRDPLDLVHRWGGRLINVREFAATLRRLSPRLYSIASSQKAHPDEVHLTVGAVRWEFDGTWRGGVCSTFLADRLDLGTKAGIFVHTSHSFRLPESPDTPIIMVGPGTGIAPFRAFIQERIASGASGKNWLFFGDQREATDFLYREEVEQWIGSGVLDRFDAAFSRDQAEKIYVQHRMREHGSILWKWLEEGAHFYVCGDARRMAKDVEATLHAIIAEEGAMDADAASAYVKRMKQEKRYQRDVY